MAAGFDRMGSLLVALGKYEEARPYHRHTLEMYRTLYPADEYPYGHPDLAASLRNMASLLMHEGKHAKAWPLICQAADMFHNLSELMLAAASEAEALDYLALFPSINDALLSVSLGLPDSVRAVYAHVWRGKAAVARTIERRRAARFSAATGDLATRQTLEAWQDTRRQLSRLLLAPSSGRADPGRLKRAQELTANKEKLERKLAETLPEFARHRQLDLSPFSKLPEILPDRTAVIDLVQYARFEQNRDVKGKSGEHSVPSYAAFMLTKGRPVERVDLGSAKPIDQAVAQSRAAIVAPDPTRLPQSCVTCSGNRSRGHLPPGATTVLIAPDGALTAVPWAALPGERAGTLLLQELGIALVPHTPFVLDRLTALRADSTTAASCWRSVVSRTARPQSLSMTSGSRPRC